MEVEDDGIRRRTVVGRRNVDLIDPVDPAGLEVQVGRSSCGS